MQSLSVGRVMLASLRAWKRDFFFLTLLAAIVETPVVLIEVTLHVAPGIDFSTDNSGDGRRLGCSCIGIPLTLYGLLAHHFLSGVMESVEGAERLGHERPTMRQLARTLPWVRLLIADFVVQFLLLAGLLLFVVPGLLVGAYLAAALPLTNMERQSLVPTLKRSIAITRRPLLEGVGRLADHVGRRRRPAGGRQRLLRAPDPLEHRRVHRPPGLRRPLPPAPGPARS